MIRSVAGVLLRIILGVLYTAMAAGQAASWPQMPQILSAYHPVPAAALPWLAAGLIAAELTAGVWLLTRPRSSALSPVWIYTAVALTWTVIGSQAYARGLPVDNCGCFGVYAGQRLSWFTLAQDALLLVYAVFMIWGSRHARAASGSGDQLTATKEQENVRMQAIWNGAVLADSDATIVVEGNHYFPADAVNWQYFTDSATHTVCPWKGTASYHTVIVDGVVNEDAAWFYPHPTEAARKVKNRVAFWNGVTVETVAADAGVREAR